MRLLIVGFILMLCLTGCAFFEGVWNGLTGQESESQKTGQLTIKTVDEISKEVKDTGKLDINKIVALMDSIKLYQKQSESEKPNWLELAGTIIGLSAGTYLGTRRVRQSKIGSMLAGLFSIFSVADKKT